MGKVAVEQTNCMRCHKEVPVVDRKFVVIQEGQTGVLVCDLCLLAWGKLIDAQKWERIMFIDGVGW